MHLELVAVLRGALDLVKVAEVDLWVNTLGKHVDTEGNEVHVSSALTVSEETSLDAVCPSHVTKLCCSYCRSTVIVRVQRNQNVLAVCEVTTHPFDGVCIDIRGSHFHRCGKVNDDLALRSGFKDLENRVTDLNGVFEFGSREALWGVFVIHLCLRNGLFHFTAVTSAVKGDIHDSLTVFTEDNFTLQNAGGVIEVNNCLLSASNSFVGALNEVVTRLSQHLNGDVIRNGIFFNK